MLRMALLLASQATVIGFGSFGLLSPDGQPPSRRNGPESPPSPAIRRTGPVDLVRNADGLFRVTALVNGRPVRFIVDTGSNIVVLSRSDARRTGTAFPDEASGRLETLAGRRPMRPATVASIRVGSRSVRNVDAAIVEEPFAPSLLGQNALRGLGTMTLQGDRMRLD